MCESFNSCKMKIWKLWRLTHGSRNLNRFKEISEEEWIDSKQFQLKNELIQNCTGRVPNWIKVFIRWSIRFKEHWDDSISKNQIPETLNELIQSLQDILWIVSRPVTKTLEAANESNQRLLHNNLNQIKNYKIIKSGEKLDTIVDDFDINIS